MWEDIMINVGDILSTVGMFSTMGDIMSAMEDILSTVGGIIWLSSKNVFQGGKIYCYANLFCYANFSVVFGPNFGGCKSLWGANCLRGRPPAPCGRKPVMVHVGIS